MANLFLVWDLATFLENVSVMLQDLGGLVIMAFGVAMIVVGVVRGAMKLMSEQHAQISWITVGLLVFVGGALMVGGFTLVADIAAGGQETILDMGESPM